MDQRVVTDRHLAIEGDFIDRRRTARRVPDAADVLSRVRLRGGRELSVINIAPDGALLEGETRLLPGTHIDVHVTTRDGRVLARARVVRGSVFRLTADSIRYRHALAFERAIDLIASDHNAPVLPLTSTGSSTQMAASQQPR
jgi:hypothetical protein